METGRPLSGSKHLGMRQCGTLDVPAMRLVLNSSFPVGVLTMAGRSVFIQGLVAALLGFPFPAATFGGDLAPGQWDPSGAAQYLDRRGENWFKFGSAKRGEGASASQCVSCHSLLPYALARPVLRRLSNEKTPTRWETQVLEQTKSRVANWAQLDEVEYQLFYDFDEPKKKQSRGTEAVLNALLLSLDDRAQGRRQPSDATKKAVSILWATQITEGDHKGSWEWLNFGLEPWESKDSRFLGATIAAIAVGATPGDGVASTDPDTRKRVDALRGYLDSHYAAQNLHNQAWLLWASSGLDGLLNSEQRDRITDSLLARQQPGGGWSLGSLGDFTHVEIKTPSTAADGYATGLVLHALQLAGLPKDHPRVKKGLDWLRANQDPTGAWRALSVNKPREPESKNPSKANVGKFMWDAATGYAVLALSH